MAGPEGVPNPDTFDGLQAAIQARIDVGYDIGETPESDPALADLLGRFAELQATDPEGFQKFLKEQNELSGEGRNYRGGQSSL